MTATLCHNCHQPAVAVVVLRDGYSICHRCFSRPQPPPTDTQTPTRPTMRRTRPGAH